MARAVILAVAAMLVAMAGSAAGAAERTYYETPYGEVKYKPSASSSATSR